MGGLRVLHKLSN